MKIPEFNDGEFILVAGESGSGKSTLLRQMKEELGLRAGFVGQDVGESIVTDKVWHELAFGLESLGRDPAFIRRKVAEMTSFFGLNEVYRKKTTELSGGGKQLVLLASVMAMEPEVLLLDEPTSQLDPIAAEKFMSVIEKIRRELGTTIIIAEHRFTELLALSDRFLIMENMEIAHDGAVRETIGWLHERNHPFCASLPVWVRMYLNLNKSAENMPFSLNGCRRLIRENEKGAAEFLEKEYKAKKAAAGEKLIKLKDISFSYAGTPVLRDLSFEIRKGSITALLGGNGSGKTTTLRIMAGLEDGYTGKLTIYGDPRIVMLPQDPRLLFTCESIGEDLRSVGNENEIKKAAEHFGLSEVLDRHPYDASGGEIQRAALLKLLLLKPDVLLLDEPTKGMEAGARDKLAGILRSFTDEGMTVVMASHDLEFAAKNADRAILLFDGEAAADEDSGGFFDGNTFYTTDGKRLMPAIKKEGKSPPPEKKSGEKKSSAAVFCMLFSVLVLMPLTVWFGSVQLENRKYYFTALLLMVELLIPAYMIFEAKKPGAIEIVVMAAMCALTVTGRVLFYMLPTIKPVIALVLLSGIAFGPLSGLMVGSTSMLISNIFFGQGPWTPWQMFVMGLIGLVGGMCGRNERFKNSTPFVCALGVFATLVIFGGIMNPASIIMYEPDFNSSMIKTAYATGFPYDLITAGFTMVFLAVGRGPILKKCERVKRYMKQEI